MPKPDSSLSAVVVSGGKQYRVAPGDQILVDRIKAEPGANFTLSRVLILNDGGEIQVGTPTIAGLHVEAKVIAHRRGPRIESIRYKSKKRVRVHHGGRADLTALSIVAIAGRTAETAREEKPETKADTKAEAKAETKAEAKAGTTARSARTKAGAGPAAKVESKAKSEAAPAKAQAKTVTRKTKKESD
ncbi:MAG: 50S ribosomal protein L21 [Candidatus Dormibacterales bacterium]